jgi:hypothetical protein
MTLLAENHIRSGFAPTHPSLPYPAINGKILPAMQMPQHTQGGGKGRTTPDSSR